MPRLLGSAAVFYDFLLESYLPLLTALNQRKRLIISTLDIKNRKIKWEQKRTSVGPFLFSKRI